MKRLFSLLGLGLFQAAWTIALADPRASAGRTGARDLLELVALGRVEVRAHGSGIQSVAMELRRTGREELIVRVPVGTYFLSLQPASQSMVATGEVTVALRDGEWVRASVPAACAERLRRIPTPGVSFEVQRAPRPRELARLMRALGKAKASSATRQAAVWIAAGDASYADLGILLRQRPDGLTNERVITEHDAVLAMRLCEQAGLDITHRAIWQDRCVIRQGLADAALRRWLDDHEPKPCPFRVAGTLALVVGTLAAGALTRRGRGEPSHSRSSAEQVL